jgi:hypothetical protein
MSPVILSGGHPACRHTCCTVSSVSAQSTPNRVSSRGADNVSNTETALPFARATAAPAANRAAVSAGGADARPGWYHSTKKLPVGLSLTLTLNTLTRTVPPPNQGFPWSFRPRSRVRPAPSRLQKLGGTGFVVTDSLGRGRPASAKPTVLVTGYRVCGRRRTGTSRRSSATGTARQLSPCWTTPLPRDERPDARRR